MTARPLYDPTQLGSVEYEPGLIELGRIAAAASRMDLYGEGSWDEGWWADRDNKHHWIRVARAVRDAIGGESDG